ncbi:hypothetical protein K466DRAFT_135409 [Polyporus arcularius HHB13444]|uniref:Uncharacterized protein n=1 Tax=Polyporus arcularius HHB13444 TaxID=1314778 RepID=A0A5C3PCY8_9APHY|nr:hypothetical protein K466DRAFT_135409 [Polyporus arcularius HHB13444]
MRCGIPGCLLWAVRHRSRLSRVHASAHSCAAAASHTNVTLFAASTEILHSTIKPKIAPVNLRRRAFSTSDLPMHLPGIAAQAQALRWDFAVLYMSACRTPSNRGAGSGSV